MDEKYQSGDRKGVTHSVKLRVIFDFFLNHSDRNKDIIRALNRVLNLHCVQKENRKMPKLLLALLIKNCLILVSNRQNEKSVKDRKIIFLAVGGAGTFKNLAHFNQIW